MSRDLCKGHCVCSFRPLQAGRCTMMGRGICSGPKELIVTLSGLTEMGMGLVEDDGGKTG